MASALAGPVIRVVLGEDHALVGNGIRMLLEASGQMKVVGLAANGQEALDLVATNAPDVAVLDIGMPVMNGIEAARRIRASHPRVALIMLSMHTARQHIVGAFRAGALGYVVKDAAVTELLDAVREVAAGRRYVSRQVSSIVLNMMANNGDETPSELELISDRERAVLELLAHGKTNAESAIVLGISTHTVDTHRRNIMAKLGFRNVVELVKFAIRHGLADTDT